MKTVFLAWVSYNRRVDIFCEHLGATPLYVSSGQMGEVKTASLRYARQAVQSWRLLKQEQPDIVIVQNPPIFAILLTALYQRLHGGRYAIDSHSGAFVSSKWRWSVGLHRRLSRHALATVVHNRSQAEIVREWGCPYCVVGFTPSDFSSEEPYPLAEGFNIAVITTFSQDEPLEMVFAAARRCPGVNFYLTGRAERCPPALLAQKPENCHLTDFLPYPRYVGLLRGVDAALVLTTRDHTLLMGGFEAISLGTPLITSDWPVLRDYFTQGTVHIPNTVEGICQGVERAQQEQDALRAGIKQLKTQLDQEWAANLAVLRALLAAR